MTTNLVPGQYELVDGQNSIVFGRHTIYPVSRCDIQSYNINAQDQQSIRSDELIFGFDNLAPSPIMFTIGVLDFKGIPTGESLGRKTFNSSAMSYGLHRLARAWRGDSSRKSFNQIVELRYCEEDGRVLSWYGRPRKFQATRRTRKSEFFSVEAEFQPVDTMVYAGFETDQYITKGADPTTVTRTTGDMPSWLRVLMTGPMTNPRITIGEQQIELDYEIEEGEVVEVSSYPWQRRVVSSTGKNLSAKMIGDTQYLDRLVIPPNTPVPVRWTADNINTWIPSLEGMAWTESIQNIGFWDLPSTFTNVHGKAAVRFDLFNFGSHNFPWITPAKYISASALGSIAAILYNHKQYATQKQYCKATLVKNFAPGRSGIVIMSNSDMTNYAILEVKSGMTRGLKIRVGSSPTTWSEVKAEWSNPSLWKETDEVAFEYVPSRNEFVGYLNDEEVVSWEDDGDLVNKNNRRQGFVFDMDGDLLTTGVGFKDIVAFDRDLVLAPVGEVVLLWRDAYSVAA